MDRAWLALAILSEVAATLTLPATERFSRPLPTLGVALGYGLSFWGLAMAVRTVPLGIAYALWAGCGIVLVAAFGWAVRGQALGAGQVAGIGLILAGVAAVNLAPGPR